MEGKTVKQSALETVQIMAPQDVNLAGNIFGGVVMKLIDSAAGAVAVRHARKKVVTASMDRLDFLSPIYPGDIMRLKASINYVGRTSMEIGVRVETEGLITGIVRHTASSYLTFVGVDEKGNPAEVPPLILETDEEKRRNRDAVVRRELNTKSRKSRETA